MGGLSALLSNSFLLYNQLGVTQSNTTIRLLPRASSIDIYVLGGLISNSSEAFTNHVSNISSTIEIARSTNNTIPNVNTTLDFSFPTILAHRQISPTLTPSSGSSVTVTLTVTNISPSGGVTG